MIAIFWSAVLDGPKTTATDTDMKRAQDFFHSAIQPKEGLNKSLLRATKQALYVNLEEAHLSARERARAFFVKSKSRLADSHFIHFDSASIPCDSSVCDFKPKRKTYGGRVAHVCSSAT